LGRVSSKVFDLAGKGAGRIRLPDVFHTVLRPDVIKRAVLAAQSHSFQPQGRDVMAGKRTTAESWGVGHAMSRVPRLRESRRAAFAPGTVGGRLSHPTVVEKRIVKRIPRKERRLALFSAIAATGSRQTVAMRGHAIDDVPDFPLVVTDDMQGVKNTKDLKEVFVNIGVWPDVYRVEESIKVRAGKGKMRGRRKKVAVGPLIVVSRSEGVSEAARNLPGVDVAYVKSLNAELLAPGCHPGRLTVWTRSSIEELANWDGGS